MNNTIKNILFLFLLALPLGITAQATGGISGKVIDSESNEPLGFVTVAVVPEGSNTPIAGVSSDDEGVFEIPNIKKGKYTVKFSYVGYISDSCNVSITGSLHKLGTIKLRSDRKLLKEVVVTEQRSQMSFDIDKRVFTVDQSIANTGGTASDVLADIPSVEVDTEGAVSLRGSESVTVWINGKASGLTGDNQGDILQQLPAGSIERIEVITNPSAKHSPEGTAGIINIILKRDRKAGYYGSAQAGADTRGGFNAGGNFNYSSGVVDAYAGLNYRNMRFKNEGHTNTKYFGPQSYINQTSTGTHNPQNIFARAGVTWHATKDDDIYINLMGMYGDRKNNSSIESENGALDTDNQPLTPTEHKRRTTNRRGNPLMYNVELGYTHRWSDTHYIDFSLSHHTWQQKENATYEQTTIEIAKADTTYSYQFQNNDKNNSRYEAKLDYAYKINDMHRIEAGYKGDFSYDNSPVKTYTDKEHKHIDQKLYNDFSYKQQTHALYGTYSGRISRFSFQLGLRGEYWNVQTRSLEWGEKKSGSPYNSKDFFKLFPSAFVSYEISDGHEIQANYTRRLRRPWGGQLNSFQNISDSTNISYGNPLLTPEYSNAYEVNYIKNWNNHTLSVSAYYRTTDDVIERISYNKDKIIYTTYENVAQEQSAGLEIIGKNKLFKILDLTTSVNLFYYKLDAFRYTIKGEEITGKADEHFSWNARMTASIILPWNMTMQITGRYNARRIVAQGYINPDYMLDIGLRKIFNQHWSLSLNARDLLNSRHRHTITENTSFYRDSKSSHGGRTFGFTLTYNFGNMKAKMPKRKPQEMPSNGYDDYGEDM
ncbi:MAG: TonB-dependent receptor [Bacteroidaceae bacterium]|nr:TonB-dependent receptor [Bacteroidaceae bacterium]